MMPAEDSIEDNSVTSQVYVFGMKEIVTYDSKLDEPNSILSIIDAVKSCDTDGSIERYTKLSDCCEDSPDVKSDISIKLEQQFSDNQFNCISSAQYAFPKKSLEELKSWSFKELQLLLEDLSSITKKVSSELVQLLLENDALQQESDARNVAIEQLLKMTVKNTEGELKQIQMSVISATDEDSDGS